MSTVQRRALQDPPPPCFLIKCAQNWKNILLIVVVAWHFSQSLVFVLVPESYDASSAHRREVYPASPGIRGNYKLHSSNQTRVICPHARRQLFPSTTDWDAILQQADDFYVRGGNHDAIQAYLNKYISSTYQRMDLPFIPFDDENPNPARIADPVEYLKDFFQKHPPTQGGYNQPLPGYFQGRNTKFLMAKKHLGGRAPGKQGINVLEPLTEERFEVAMGPMLFGPNATSCHVLEIDDKSFCDMLPSIVAPVSEECHVFSIGSNDEWGYEKDFVKYAPHCQIHTFDCTLQNPRKMPQNYPQLHFYPYCLGASNQSEQSTTEGEDRVSAKNNKYRSYSELVHLAQAQRSPPKLLKMDIEGFEYSVLLDLLRNSPSHIWPEQISLEVHWATRMVDLDWMLRTKTAAEMSLWFSTLYLVGGYLPVARKFFTVGCPSCVELLLVRVTCEA